MQYASVPTSFGSAMVPVPNVVQQGDDFYVSYNDHDYEIYGSDTTALVRGQMERFYILDGDHRAAYRDLIPQGMAACMAYYRENIALSNRRSDPLES